MASGAKTFLSFDQELRESGRTGPRAFGVVRAYELPDQSLVIFGAANARGDTAAVAKLSADNHWTASPIGPLHESYTVFDAVPTNSPYEYVMARTLVHPVPGTPQPSSAHPLITNETVLEWLKINE